MAFSFNPIKRLNVGNVKMEIGTFTNDDDSEGGTITVLDMHSILNISLQHTGSSVVAGNPAVNESMSGTPPRINKNSVEIVTTANACGCYLITGI